MTRWSTVGPALALAAAMTVATSGCDDGGGDDGSDGSTPDAAGAADAADPADAGPPSCMTYCAIIQDNCKFDEGVQQYGLMSDCIATCSTFPIGTQGDMGGNSLACRQYHAEQAASDPDTHCAHAGPGGAGTCGTNCESFCNSALAICTGSMMTAQPFASLSECMEECALFADTEEYDTSDVAGNTLACRLYHLTAASTDMATHCGHIDTVSESCI